LVYRKWYARRSIGSYVRCHGRIWMYIIDIFTKKES
jgi:hypothetical protein